VLLKRCFSGVFSVAAAPFQLTPVSLVLLAFLLPTSCLKGFRPIPPGGDLPEYQMCIRFCVQQLQYCMEQRGCGRVFGEHMPKECKWAYKICCETCDRNFDVVPWVTQQICVTILAYTSYIALPPTRLEIAYKNVCDYSSC